MVTQQITSRLPADGQHPLRPLDHQRQRQRPAPAHHRPGGRIRCRMAATLGPSALAPRRHTRGEDCAKRATAEIARGGTSGASPKRAPAPRLHQRGKEPPAGWRAFCAKRDVWRWQCDARRASRGAASVGCSGKRKRVSLRARVHGRRRAREPSRARSLPRPHLGPPRQRTCRE